MAVGTCDSCTLERELNGQGVCEPCAPVYGILSYGYDGDRREGSRARRPDAPRPVCESCGYSGMFKVFFAAEVQLSQWSDMWSGDDRHRCVLDGMCVYVQRVTEAPTRVVCDSCHHEQSQEWIDRITWTGIT